MIDRQAAKVAFAHGATEAMRQLGFVACNVFEPVNQDASVIGPFARKGGSGGVHVVASGRELLLNSEPERMKALIAAKVAAAVAAWNANSPGVEVKTH